MSVLSVRGLHVSYGAGAQRLEVLRGLDLDIAAGHLAAVVGPSGCGKTTLLRTVAGFITPDAGTIIVDDAVVAGARGLVPPEKRGVTLVPQEGALFPHLDVAGNVAFGLPRRGSQSRVSELLSLVGLSGMESRRPSELSGGQQQRVALARALAPQPKLVLLDEPFSALDAGLRESVRADVRQVLRRAGTTALLITHDQDEALSVADSVAVMDQGLITMHGSPEEVYAAPSDLGVARFVGQVVELPAQAEGLQAHTPLGVVALSADTSTPDLSGAGTVTLRPEQIRFCADGEDGVLGQVQERTYYGHDATVAVRLVDESGQPGQRIIVRTTGMMPAEDTVRLAVIGAGRFFPAG